MYQLQASEDLLIVAYCSLLGRCSAGPQRHLVGLGPHGQQGCAVRLVLLWKAGPVWMGLLPARLEDGGCGVLEGQVLPGVLRQVCRHGCHCPGQPLCQVGHHCLASPAADMAEMGAMVLLHEGVRLVGGMAGGTQLCLQPDR